MGHYRNEKGEEAGPILMSDTVAGTGARDRFINALTCSYCGQTGAILWEENAADHRQCGPQRRLVSVSAGFHTETGRTESGDPIIVCANCDTIQAD